MRKSIKINNKDVPLRQLTYGENDECLILSETLVQYNNQKGEQQLRKITKDSIYVSEAVKRMLCVKKPHEIGYKEELAEKSQWLKSLDLEDGKKIRKLALEILNTEGDVEKK